MPLTSSILYRGTLSSCNYDCPYCPFGKHWESAAEIDHDRKGLDRFCRWAASRTSDTLSVFFTPWGEALVRQWYRDAVTRLSRLSHIRKVAVQTNLSCNLDWLAAADVRKVGLWCTYHPGQTTREAFLAQCSKLTELGVLYSVGCVGLLENIPEIERLREALPANVYLWVNAYKGESDYYESTQVDLLNQIDPLFPTNNQRHPSLGRACRSGASVFTVDGNGDMRRCHFVSQVIGNIYEPEFEKALMERPCPNATCGCHIGYVYLDHLQLDSVYGTGMLERIPVEQHFQSAPRDSALSGDE